MPVELQSFTKRPYPDEVTEFGKLAGKPAESTRRPLRDRRLLSKISVRFGPGVSVSRLRISGGRLREFPEPEALQSGVRAILATQDQDGSNKSYCITPGCEVIKFDFLIKASPDSPLSQKASGSGRFHYLMPKVALKNGSPVFFCLEIRTVLTNPPNEG